MTRNSRLNSLSATKDKRLLFKVVKTNWTHNNRPFLDTTERVDLGRYLFRVKQTFVNFSPFCNIDTVHLEKKPVRKSKRKKI